jgi:hypothetical protein
MVKSEGFVIGGLYIGGTAMIPLTCGLATRPNEYELAARARLSEKARMQT